MLRYPLCWSHPPYFSPSHAYSLSLISNKLAHISRIACINQIGKPNCELFFAPNKTFLGYYLTIWDAMAARVSLLQKDIIPYNRVHTSEATSVVYLFFTACITNRPILFLSYLPFFPTSYFAWINRTGSYTLSACIINRQTKKKTNRPNLCSVSTCACINRIGSRRLSAACIMNRPTFYLSLCLHKPNRLP